MADFGNRNSDKIRRRTRSTANLRDVSKNNYTPPVEKEKRENPRKKRKRRSIKLKNRRLDVLVIFIFVIILLALFSIFSKNAYDITVDGESVGVIKKTNIEVSDINNTVIAGIEQQLGSKIQINEEIGMKAVRVSKKDMVTIDYVISKIKENVTYKVEAAVITVDGIEAAVLSNTAEADKLLNEIKSEYIPEDKKDKMEASFVEDVQVVSKYVNSDDIITADVAKSKFQQTTKVSKTYTVQSGDTLSKIADAAVMTMDEFYAENPGITTTLKLGQVVNILVDKPALSVKTIETNIFTEIAKKQVKYQTDSSKPASYQKVIQQGSDGQKEITVQTIRINGFEEEQAVVSENITQEPVDEIIEVGAK